MLTLYKSEARIHVEYCCPLCVLFQALEGVWSGQKLMEPP